MSMSEPPNRWDDDLPFPNSYPKTASELLRQNGYLGEGLLSNRKLNPSYKYNEGELIKQLKAYVDATYDQHYAQGDYQATEVIIDMGHGVGFTIGNVVKYAQRYGKKEGYNRADLLKVLHYALITLYIHDKEMSSK